MAWIGYIIAAFGLLGLIGAAIVILFTFIFQRRYYKIHDENEYFDEKQ